MVVISAVINIILDALRVVVIILIAFICIVIVVDVVVNIVVVGVFIVVVVIFVVVVVVAVVIVVVVVVVIVVVVAVVAVVDEKTRNTQKEISSSKLLTHFGERFGGRKSTNRKLIKRNEISHLHIPTNFHLISRGKILFLLRFEAVRLHLYNEKIPAILNTV